MKLKTIVLAALMTALLLPATNAGAANDGTSSPQAVAGNQCPKKINGMDMREVETAEVHRYITPGARQFPYVDMYLPEMRGCFGAKEWKSVKVTGTTARCTPRPIYGWIVKIQGSPQITIPNGGRGKGIAVRMYCDVTYEVPLLGIPITSTSYFVERWYGRTGVCKTHKNCAPVVSDVVTGMCANTSRTQCWYL